MRVSIENVENDYLEMTIPEISHIERRLERQVVTATIFFDSEKKIRKLEGDFTFIVYDGKPYSQEELEKMILQLF